MRSGGLWHPRLAELVVTLGHTETLVVADPGLPVPRDVETVDLVWARGEPSLVPVLGAIVGELVVESALIADDLVDDATVKGIHDVLTGVPLDRTPHRRLKGLARRARAVVRTGEATPYANVVLRAGVAF